MARQCKLRLAVHCKNEFRKKYAKQRNYNVVVNPYLMVNVPLMKTKPKGLDIQSQALEPVPDETCLISTAGNT